MNKPSPPPRANFFDASALVKVFANESDGSSLRDYWNSRSPTKHTTPFCFYEALSILKGKWVNRQELTKEQYLESSFRLWAWFNGATRHAKDVDLHDVQTFFKVKEVAERHSLDLSDALQIISVKDGYFSALINDSRTVLVTADKALSVAARAEGLRVWYCVDEQEP